MAVPHPTRVWGGPRSRPVCLAPAPALAGGARDACHHRVSPAGGTRGSGRDPGRRFGRRDRQTARARAGGRGDAGRGARPAATVRHYPPVFGDPGAQGSGRAASAGGVVRGASAARAHRTGMTMMRLQRALARAGVTSRRKAEELIRAGRVRVDGQVTTLGMSVDPGRQRVTVDGRAVRAGPIAWLALNKPVGYVVSRRDPEGRRTGSRSSGCTAWRMGRCGWDGCRRGSTAGSRRARSTPSSDCMDLRDRTAMILGGSGLVGHAVARRLLAAAPRRLVLVALFEEEVRATARALEPYRGSALIEGDWGDVFLPASLAQFERR